MRNEKYNTTSAKFLIFFFQPSVTIIIGRDAGRRRNDRENNAKKKKIPFDSTPGWSGTEYIYGDLYFRYGRPRSGFRPVQDNKTEFPPRPISVKDRLGFFATEIDRGTRGDLSGPEFVNASAPARFGFQQVGDGYYCNINVRLRNCVPVFFNGPTPART